ncbi:3-deoxy-manno-octulosonate cytidylyltransferase [Jannaschia seosinensis]|uniref:3-deoxy-manno-octulosonate cytidylyltransferase n=1 Tax=Jannaschia seosinensis TaxID=313367 RepID=A0A0M7B872_9RHOB|nr:manno-octulosonate cytidylyltransferase [Jannaschia seosinensis]CUH38977.1 3-deoxy-manno-octulosonate cytidylyltransferase [Jannaschia seosinensis]
MKTTILIPARYASSRYPGKPLVELRQGDGSFKSLIRMTWEAAQQVRGVDAVHVATDDDRIRAACEDFGASVLMTSRDAANGTERCADTLDRLEADLIVNLQGDAPLTPPWFIEALIARMAEDTKAAVATPVLRCDRRTYDMFVEDRRAGRVGGTTAVFDARGHGLYFTKEVVPYIHPDKVPAENIPVFHHVGVYAYRPDALRAYVGWPEGVLERNEGLEQLRFIENGATVACVEVESRGRVFWELNNPEDVPRIEAVLKGE